MSKGILNPGKTCSSGRGYGLASDYCASVAVLLIPLHFFTVLWVVSSMGDHVLPLFVLETLDVTMLSGSKCLVVRVLISVSNRVHLTRRAIVKIFRRLFLNSF